MRVFFFTLTIPQEQSRHSPLHNAVVYNLMTQEMTLERKLYYHLWALCFVKTVVNLSDDILVSASSAVRYNYLSFIVVLKVRVSRV